MGNILGKPKNKLKDFLDNSKKLVQAPKELPELTGEKGERKTVNRDMSFPPLPPRPQRVAIQPVMYPSQAPALPATPAAPKEIRPLEMPKKELNLPKIEHTGFGGLGGIGGASMPPAPHAKAVKVHDEDLKRFEEAINNINIDIIHSETPSDAYAASNARREEDDYYEPAEMGEGYFSEIEHYIRNKDINEIIDDVLKKDFLSGMKDYHDTKSQGKPFFFNKDDLKSKLKIKMDALRRLEEEWHILKTQIAEEERKKMTVENEIDQQSQELKELFKQIKTNQWLEQEAPKEHYFWLKNGQELKSLNDLRKALNYMNDEDFNHHVNQERNDFATWIRDALGIQELYEKIKDIKSKQELQQILQTPL